MNRRTYASPATARQIAYITDLLADREVPRYLREEIERAIHLGVLVDGDCRVYIPDLEDLPYRRRGFRPGRYDGSPDNPMADWENWRDHPDAIAGHPGEHGSH